MKRGREASDNYESPKSIYNRAKKLERRWKIFKCSFLYLSRAVKSHPHPHGLGLRV
jgi:hypothetical protein